MSFRFLSSEFSIKYFLSCFIQFWLLDQKFHSLDCTGWKYPTIIVSHVRVNSKGYIRGIPLDREGIGEDPAMEVQCSSQNRLRFNKPLMHRVDNLAAIRIISLKDLPGNGGVSTLSLHDQSLLTIHLQLPGTGESTTPPIHTSSSSRNHGHRVQVHQPKRRRLNFTTRSIPPAHT
ncbi:hypothetical protein Pelo_11427 [Pelomyxa schiedti]|nr:hypothetical protein Pelo_11427 [Pelomyxa schiedti]